MTFRGEGGRLNGSKLGIACLTSAGDMPLSSMPIISVSHRHLQSDRSITDTSFTDSHVYVQCLYYLKIP